MQIIPTTNSEIIAERGIPASAPMNQRTTESFETWMSAPIITTRDATPDAEDEEKQRQKVVSLSNRSTEFFSQWEYQN